MKTNKAWILAAEAIAIVASILLAFAIDAWWEARGDREAEQAAIKRLIVEFSANLEQLDSNKARHRTALDATERLLRLIGPEQDRPDDVAILGRLLVDCLQNPTYDPVLGTTQSLIASGDLDLIRDEPLQGMLTNWPARAEDLREWQIIERNHGEELILPFTYDYVAWPSVEHALGHDTEPSRFESDFDRLFSSLRLEGMLNNRRYNLRELISDIQTLEQETLRLIEALRSQVAGSK